MYNKTLADIEYSVIDFETTGWSPYSGNKIVEVGIVKFDFTIGIIDKFASLVNPEIPIPYNCSRIHGITDEHVTNSPLIEDIINQISEFIKDSVLIMHNAPFDYRFLNYEFKKNEQYNDYNENLIIIDTLRMARKLLPDISHSLTDLSRHYGFETNFHRALNDAETTYNIFKKMCIEYFNPHADYLIDFKNLEYTYSYQKK